MKIAFFAKSHKRSGITTHIARALRGLGHETVWINRHRSKRFLGKKLSRWWIHKRVERFKPDLILIFTRDIELGMLKELAPKIPTAQFYDDCNIPLRDEVVEYGRTVGHFFITARGQVEDYRARGVEPVTYVTGGCDATDHYRVPAADEFRSEVAFIGSPGPEGSLQQQDRVALMTRLAEAFDLKVYGRGWDKHGITVARDSVFPPQYRTICNSAKVMIGLDSFADVDLYFSNRTWITLGCGGLLATRYVPNLEEILQDGRELVWWNDPEECVAKVRELLDDPDRAERIRQAGHAYAHKEYSYTRMCERMLAAIEERGAGPVPTPAEVADESADAG